MRIINYINKNICITSSNFVAEIIINNKYHNRHEKNNSSKR